MEVISDQEQKVFRLPGVGREVACTFYGMVHLLDDAGDIAFDFISECRNAAKSLDSVPFANASELAARIGQQLERGLVGAKERGRLATYPKGKRWPGERENEIVRIYVDGYFNGCPSPAILRLGQEDQQPFFRREPRDLYPQHRAALMGSQEIEHLLFQTEDPRFAKYRSNSTRRIGLRRTCPSTPVTLLDSIEAARNYIAACSDPTALEIDAKTCENIGGHIHIAAITPENGFYWVDPPLNGPSALG